MRHALRQNLLARKFSPISSLSVTFFLVLGVSSGKQTEWRHEDISRKLALDWNIIWWIEREMSFAKRNKKKGDKVEKPRRNIRAWKCGKGSYVQGKTWKSRVYFFFEGGCSFLLPLLWITVLLGHSSNVSYRSSFKAGMLRLYNHRHRYHSLSSTSGLILTRSISYFFFYILLTVHLSIVLATGQLNAQILVL